LWHHERTSGCDVGIDAPRLPEVGIGALLVALFCLGGAALEEIVGTHPLIEDAVVLAQKF
jgi:hypothetical protein